MFPIIALKSYTKNKKKIRFRKLIEKVIFKLNKFKSLLQRVNYIHQEVDYHLGPILNDNIVKKLITCHKGCTACCHTQVSITDDESKFLVNKIIYEEIDIDWRKLSIQAKVKNNSAAYLKIPYELRSCIFLSESKTCRIYNDRPSVCRTNLVLSKKEDCSTKDGVEHPIRMLNTELSDTVIIGAFAKSKISGALPFMLYKTFSKIKSI